MTASALSSPLATLSAMGRFVRSLDGDHGRNRSRGYRFIRESDGLGEVEAFRVDQASSGPSTRGGRSTRPRLARRTRDRRRRARSGPRRRSHPRRGTVAAASPRRGRRSPRLCSRRWSRVVGRSAAVRRAPGDRSSTTRSPARGPPERAMRPGRCVRRCPIAGRPSASLSGAALYPEWIRVDLYGLLRRGSRPP